MRARLSRSPQPARRGRDDFLAGRLSARGLFLPPPDLGRPTPAIICIGEPGQRKEEYLHKVARYAADRGMALLAVDLLGAGRDARFDEVVGRSDPGRTR